MDNDTRDYLEKHFRTLYERHDALKDTLNGVHLRLASTITKHEEQLAGHAREIGLFRQRGWQFVLGIVTGAASLVWHAINATFGAKH
jgi:hypothetical protein